MSLEHKLALLRASDAGREIRADDDCFEVKPHTPHTFWNPDGAYFAVRKMFPRGLPSAKGAKFLTFTVDRSQYDSPQEAFHALKKEPAYAMQRLRKKYQIHGYILKFELHKDAWPHWHAIVWTGQKIDLDDLNAAWGFGWAHVKRVKGEGTGALYYALKYITKDCVMPEWVRQETRIQVCRKSQRFYEELEAAGHEFEPIKPKREVRALMEKKRVLHVERTLGERADRWLRQAKVTIIECGRRRHSVVECSKPYLQIFSQFVQLEIQQTVKRRYRIKTRQRIVTENRIHHAQLIRAIAREPERFEVEREAHRRWPHIDWRSYDYDGLPRAETKAS